MAVGFITQVRLDSDGIVVFKIVVKNIQHLLVGWKCLIVFVFAYLVIIAT